MDKKGRPTGFDTFAKPKQRSSDKGANEMGAVRSLAAGNVDTGSGGQKGPKVPAPGKK